MKKFYVIAEKDTEAKLTELLEGILADSTYDVYPGLTEAAAEEELYACQPDPGEVAEKWVCMEVSVKIIKEGYPPNTKLTWKSVDSSKK